MSPGSDEGGIAAGEGVYSGDVGEYGGDCSSHQRGGDDAEFGETSLQGESRGWTLAQELDRPGAYGEGDRS